MDYAIICKKKDPYWQSFYIALWPTQPLSNTEHEAYCRIHLNETRSEQLEAGVILLGGSNV